MANKFQFDDFEGRKLQQAPQCMACEAMLTDALDQSLDAVDQAWFDRHIASCSSCSQMLADAQRGAAWLEMLKAPRPEPSAALMERILAQTTGKEALGESAHQPLLAPITILPTAPNVLPFRPRASKIAWTNAFFEPRLAMTAAMAFFSIALTLNLTGVQLNRVHLSDLNPTNLKRSYYEANASAARYYDNLRVVRVMESRVDDLRQTTDDNTQQQPSSQPDNKPQQQQPANDKKNDKNDKPGPGQSLRQTPPAARSNEEGGLV